MCDMASSATQSPSVAQRLATLIAATRDDVLPAQSIYWSKIGLLDTLGVTLAGAIEDKRPESDLDRLVSEGVAGVFAQTGNMPPHRAILGCTHFPLVEHLFRRHLPPFTRILSQPDVVADSFEDYLHRRPHYLAGNEGGRLTLLTTGDPIDVSSKARVFWPDVAAFAKA